MNKQKFFLCYNREPVEPNKAFSIWNVVSDFPLPKPGKTLPMEYVGSKAVAKNYSVMEVFNERSLIGKILTLLDFIDDTLGSSNRKGIHAITDLINRVALHAIQRR